MQSEFSNMLLGFEEVRKKDTDQTRERGEREREKRDPDLQVAVQNVCGMNVLHRLQKLIQNVALMYILQNVRVDNRMKVSLWEVSAVFFSFFFF
jgi:hypothetical protein